MVDRVPASEVETLVGIERDRYRHFGRADTAVGKFFILHSQACRDGAESITQCEYSLALESGLNEAEWYSHEDRPVPLALDPDGRIVPGRRQ